jgi:hypothetical protein
VTELRKLYNCIVCSMPPCCDAIYTSWDLWPLYRFSDVSVIASNKTATGFQHNSNPLSSTQWCVASGQRTKVTLVRKSLNRKVPVTRLSFQTRFNRTFKIKTTNRRFSRSSETYSVRGKGPTADATDAPQPWGLLCNPVMKMIRFFRFSK